jgi:hypothetical protein
MHGHVSTTGTGYSTGMRDKIEERDKIEAQEGLQ